ncbi:hypothetical protein [Butyrivibrio sp. VCD2006]|uniref:hypothetical protein n=1 Tax=Butyrivibrio sp. VCD2006 TaxID=1280664 RepID=UPI00047DDDEA|nr:hypothetical protein [Butyrivibrio sp. VCD2006]
MLSDGEEVIVPESLSEATPYSNYTAHGKVRSQERDVLKYWNNSHIRLAAVGFENQTDVDDDMPIRVINYDGAGYWAQLRPSAKNKRYPLVSLVLYYSYEKWWNKAVLLVQEMLSLMSALTDDNRFVETYEQVKGRERVSMCNVLDEIEEKGIEKGKTCAKNEDVKSLAEYLMKEKLDLSWEEAVKMAEEILKK